MLLTLDALAEMVDQLHQVAGPGRDLSLWVQADDDVPLAITEGNVVVAASAEEALDRFERAGEPAPGACRRLTDVELLELQLEARQWLDRLAELSRLIEEEDRG